jgi:hypothetical protein
MSDETVYEIEIKVRSRDQEAVRHIEGPLPHETVEDVAVDLVGTLTSRSHGKVRHIAGTDR